PAAPDYDADDLDGFRAHFEAKAREVEARAPSFAAQGGDIERLRALMAELGARAYPRIAPEAEAKLGEAEALLGLPPADLATDASRAARVELGLSEVTRSAPGWVARGGSAKELQDIMSSFAELLGDGAPAPYLLKERKLDEALARLGLTYTPGDLG